eukprot:TRINITY_DN64200_c0_g1_i1.p2 TRINITY_DN64200_c0_g1~~TRINITY_DN64200_c0_g1_i1.p2  ORF type:complete len:100 (+),score=13.74 TRINITY_DN64200_c0_g1_i1:277-576(+)
MRSYIVIALMMALLVVGSSAAPTAHSRMPVLMRQPSLEQVRGNGARGGRRANGENGGNANAGASGGSAQNVANHHRNGENERRGPTFPVSPLLNGMRGF